MKPIKLLVCGGRDFNDQRYVSQKLDQVCQERGWWGEYGPISSPVPLCLIHGGARGADMCADYWGTADYLVIQVFPANWDKYGKAAGYIRNKEMLDQHPDLVVAFPGGKGTAMMVDIATKAGVEVVVFDGHL